MMTGREKRFKQIICQYQHKIFRLCHSYVKNEEDKKDVFNNILIRIWRGLDSFGGKSLISTWLYRITVNSCIDFIRVENNKNQQKRKLSMKKIDLVADSTDIESEFLMSRQIADMYMCIDRLSLLDKTIISLYLEDLSYMEIADIIGISGNYVGVKLNRIKKNLNICLQEK
jgi:RNA polymerase sigma-70 factor (ECF subfamily)